MGYSTRPVNKSQHRVRNSTWGDGSVVLPGRNISGLEIDWLTLVDLWQTYALPLVPDLLLTNANIGSGVREEHPLVSHRVALYATSLRLTYDVS
jgi:hypothetical protein